MRFLPSFFEPRRVEFATGPYDGLSWKWNDVPGPVYAIGDVHGDLRSLTALLTDRSLIDDEGHWTGERAHLVLLGDLIGGHRESRLVLNLVMRLEEEAIRAGGKVHSLLGNHDVMVFGSKTGKATSDEKKLYKEFPIRGLDRPSWKKAFAARTPYGEWLTTRNSVIQIGDTLFCHAGLERWVFEAEIGRVNATVRAWLRYWQGISAKPLPQSRWTVGKATMQRHSPLSIGPLWTRVYKISDDDRASNGWEPKDLEAAFKKIGVQRMVVGHAPTPYKEAVLAHPYYGEQVVMIDTGLYKEKGNPCTLEIGKDCLNVHYVDRPEKETPSEKAEWARLEKPSRRPSWRDLFGRFFGKR